MSAADGTAEKAGNADTGLARERTELAWTRTTISFAALGGVILKVAPVVGLVMMALSVVIWELGRRPRSAGTGARPGRLGLITVTITSAALVTLILTLLKW